jgi:Undecaprenyl-phosphate galactose phosphotransferase WbaP
MGLYPGVLLDPIEEFRRLSISIALGMALVVVATFLAKEANEYSRLVFLVAIPLAVGLSVSGRWIVRRMCGQSRWWGVPTIVVGPPDDIDLIRRMVGAHPGIGIRIVAAVHADLEKLPFRAEEQVASGTIPYALVVIPAGADARWIRNVERMVWGCEKIILIPQSLGLLWSGMHIQDCCGIVGLAVQRHLLRRWSRTTKRVMDLVLALAGSVLILPWIVIIAMTVKLSSRGSVFYSQERIGEGGRGFHAWKFRTMVENADVLLEQYLESEPQMRAEWAASHKLRTDPRVTKVGKFLRQTSLDELPQIWNVIRGEMSLVGPRPIVHQEAVKYGDELDLYRKVRPGITGLWQVSGRSDTTYDGRVAMDVHYVRNWSVWLDVYLLVRTVGVVLRKQGAY